MSGSEVGVILSRSKMDPCFVQVRWIRVFCGIEVGLLSKVEKFRVLFGIETGPGVLSGTEVDHSAYGSEMVQVVE